MGAADVVADAYDGALAAEELRRAKCDLIVPSPLSDQINGAIALTLSAS